MTAPDGTRGQRVFDVVPLALAIVAEAAWIAVIAWIAQEYALRPATLGIAELALFVLAGVLLARTIGRRVGGGWPVLAVALAVVGGIAGWLTSGDARAALAVDGPGAVVVDPGGWLAGLAVVRGYAHATMPLKEGSIGHLLAVGIPGLAVVSLMGGLIREPFRTEFLDRALVGAVVFVVAGTLALALARLNAIGRVAGFSWRRNPAWTAVVVLLVGSAVLVAVPASGVAGRVMDVLIGVSLIPMLILGLALGFDRAGKATLVFFAFVAFVIIVLGRVLPPTGVTPPPIAPTPVTPTATSGANTVLAVVALLVFVAAIVTVAILAIAWLRRSPAEEDDVFETRTIDRNIGLPARRPRRRFGRRPAPADAAAAYEALIEDLAGREAVARHASETPAEHAARLRRGAGAAGGVVGGVAAGGVALSLDLLAADYALDRFAGRTLPAREHRRAIDRWRRLRRSLSGEPRA